MGNSITKFSTPEEVADFVAAIGDEFAVYRGNIVRNEVTGDSLLMLCRDGVDLNQMLECLGITSELHRISLQGYMEQLCTFDAAIIDLPPSDSASQKFTFTAG